MTDVHTHYFPKAFIFISVIVFHVCQASCLLMDFFTNPTKCITEIQLHIEIIAPGSLRHEFSTWGLQFSGWS